MDYCLFRIKSCEASARLSSSTAVFFNSCLSALELLKSSAVSLKCRIYSVSACSNSSLKLYDVCTDLNIQNHYL